MTEDVSSQLAKLQALRSMKTAQPRPSREQLEELEEQRQEIVRDLLERVHVLSMDERRAWERYNEALLARDGLVSEIVTTKAKPHGVPAADIARVLGVDRTWPYGIRKSYRTRWHEWREFHPDPQAVDLKQAE